MTKTNALKLPDGTTILVEVEEIPMNAMATTRGAPAPTQQITRELSEVLPAVRGIASSLLESLEGLARKPDTVSVEFGLKIGGEVGVILTKGTAEANFKLSLSWKSS
ncbi:MAG: hypothetical protein KGZ83_05510 [Sulfuricella sp.]|nr:hypothetical protein [Sulfuricella sp.]